MATAKKSTRKSSSTRASTQSSKTPARRRSSGAGETDAIDLLTEDHRNVDELFEDYESIKEDGDDAAKEELVAQICNELTVHATIEEEIFYPAAREAVDDDDADMLDEAEVEHEHVKMLVDELRTMTPGESLYDAKVKVLSEYVKHHVEEEEGEIFPTLRDADLDLEALGAQLAERKQQLMGEMQETAAS
jgi:hemerythrin superfamily protein